MNFTDWKKKKMREELTLTVSLLQARYFAYICWSNIHWERQRDPRNPAVFVKPSQTPKEDRIRGQGKKMQIYALLMKTLASP